MRERKGERERLPPLVPSPTLLPAVAAFLYTSQLAEAAGFFVSFKLLCMFGACGVRVNVTRD